MAEKPKVALYWAASCGGCEISVLEIWEKLLDLAAAVDIVFWPVAIDAKYHHVEAMEDKSIDLCLFNGAIRTAENEHMARLLRRKSKVLVAYGSCSHMGGIPSLSNLYPRQETLNRAFLESESTDNPEKVIPRTKSDVPEGELELPEFYERVASLDQVVEVDYYVPGCPPTGEQTWNVLAAVLEAKLPAPGSVVGVNPKTVCDECDKKKQEKRVSRFFRPHEINPDPEVCLLEQGIICMGPATRAGCGGQCVSVNMPCRGCYGPPEGVVDQGAKMLSAVASIIDSNDPEEIARIMQTIPDPAGTFYRFSMSHSLLRGAKSK